MKDVTISKPWVKKQKFAEIFAFWRHAHSESTSRRKILRGKDFEKQECSKELVSSAEQTDTKFDRQTDRQMMENCSV